MAVCRLDTLRDLAAILRPRLVAARSALVERLDATLADPEADALWLDGVLSAALNAIPLPLTPPLEPHQLAALVCALPHESARIVSGLAATDRALQTAVATALAGPDAPPIVAWSRVASALASTGFPKGDMIALLTRRLAVAEHPETATVAALVTLLFTRAGPVERAPALLALATHAPAALAAAILSGEVPLAGTSAPALAALLAHPDRALRLAVQRAVARPAPALQPRPRR